MRFSSPAVFRALLCAWAMSPALLAGPIRFLAWDEQVAARKIGFADAKGLVELQDLHPNKRSSPVDANAEGQPLRLVAMDRNAADGKPVEIAIPFKGNPSRPLVLILPDPQHPTGLRPFAVDDDPAGFGWGSIRFINATGKTLMVRHDKAVKELPGSWTPVEIIPGGQPRRVGILVATKDDLENILYSAVWDHEPDIRKLVFVLPGADVRTGAVDLKIIPEDRRAVAMAQQAEGKEPQP